MTGLEVLALRALIGVIVIGALAAAAWYIASNDDDHTPAI